MERTGAYAAAPSRYCLVRAGLMRSSTVPAPVIAATTGLAAASWAGVGFAAGPAGFASRGSSGRPWRVASLSRYAASRSAADANALTFGP